MPLNQKSKEQSSLLASFTKTGSIELTASNVAQAEKLEAWFLKNKSKKIHVQTLNVSGDDRFYLVPDYGKAEELPETSLALVAYHTVDKSNMYAHWSTGLTMELFKDGVQMSLNSDDIVKIVNNLPKTISGNY